ncbi:uncharacterized protein N7496_012742 [Penicillium cataractarum]|uniref:Uncharacterized protein n=1 Tax=Penicillium cataractarum TaxID=2100454 RepID=A0A9W9R9L4_9EURO|nr:uncharacterized protein N7496_012742 [Penicillium cataractarum]KAJ5355530.1 hypothetical protein N7496_012742 [Penicillium cataractarum]
MGLFGVLQGGGASTESYDVPDIPDTAAEPSRGDSFEDVEPQPDPVKEMENLHRENESLMQRLEIAGETTKAARRVQLIAEERLRRQNELLRESRKNTETALKEQSQTLSKLTELQKWTESIDDGEVVEVMRKLFQRLEDWTKRHFNEVFHVTQFMRNAHIDGALLSYRNSPLTIQVIQAAISEEVLRGIFSRFMVGLPDRSCDAIFLEIDTKVSRSFPLHVWQHWRSSTSRAVASLAREEIGGICDQITQNIDDVFGWYTLTDTMDRKHELKDLLLECVRFKMTLDRQASIYFFHGSCPGTPFSEERMRSFTGVCSTEATVSQSIWPMLCKGSSDNWIIVEKEVVHLIELDPATLTETEFSADLYSRSL